METPDPRDQTAQLPSPVVVDVATNLNHPIGFTANGRDNAHNVRAQEILVLLLKQHAVQVGEEQVLLENSNTLRTAEDWPLNPFAWSNAWDYIHQIAFDETLKRLLQEDGKTVETVTRHWWQKQMTFARTLAGIQVTKDNKKFDVALAEANGEGLVGGSLKTSILLQRSLSQPEKERIPMTFQVIGSASKRKRPTVLLRST